MTFPYHIIGGAATREDPTGNTGGRREVATGGDGVADGAPSGAASGDPIGSRSGGRAAKDV